MRATSGGKVFGKIAAVGLLALGLVGGVWYWQDAKEKDEARIALEQKAEEEREAAEAARRIAEEKSKKEKAESERKLNELARRLGADQEEVGRNAEKEEAQDKVQLWEGGPYWADRNIGAEKPEDYGYYFWWSDTVGYKRDSDRWVASDGSNSDFSFGMEDAPTYGKSISNLENEGWIVGKNGEYVLAPNHDAAQAHWGGNWRMPTDKEFNELERKCDWTWTTKNGVNGYIVRGKGNYSTKSIFLPCAGCGDGTSLYRAGSYGYYWSSVPDSDSNLSWYLYFDSSRRSTSNGSRGRGPSVRPLQGFTK